MGLSRSSACEVAMCFDVLVCKCVWLRHSLPHYDMRTTGPFFPKTRIVLLVN